MAGGEREDGGGLQGVLERVGCEYTDPLRSSRLGSDSASRCRLRVQGLVWWGGLSQYSYRHPHEQPFCKRNAAHSRHGVGHFRPRLVALRLRGRICTRTHAVRGGGAVLVSVKATVCGDSGGCAGGFGFRVSPFTGDSHAGEMQWDVTHLGAQVQECSQPRAKESEERHMRKGRACQPPACQPRLQRVQRQRRY